MGARLHVFRPQETGGLPYHENLSNADWDVCYPIYIDYVIRRDETWARV